MWSWYVCNVKKMCNVKSVCVLCEGGGSGEGAAAADAGNYKDFTTQYAKSGQSVCRGCDNKIEKVRQ